MDTLKPQIKVTDEEVRDAFRKLLAYVGEDPTREGLLETPERMRKAWLEWCAGYEKDPAPIMKVFKDGGEGVDQMVVVANIPFYSQCEHHLAPFFGTITIAYLPNELIVGLSKFKRLVEVYARRLQVQERLTVNIADAIQKHVKPLGVGVYVKARHMCVESRGAKCHNSETITTALRGAFVTDASTKAEFLDCCKS